jgi:hypothetical protein
LSEAPPPSEPAAAPEAAAPTRTPRCATHPETDAIGACTRCGSFFCPSCKGWEHSQERYCVRCDPGGPYVAWEDREKLGTFRAFTKTLKTLLLSPDRFFLRMPASGGYGAPIAFAWISWALSSVVTAAAYGVLVGGIFAIMPLPEGDAAPVGQVMAGFLLGSVAAVLVGIIPMLFLWSLLLHVMTKIFGGEGSFEATFRCHAYSSGVFALGVIPFVGLSVAQFYWVVLQIFAVKNAHRMSTGRAAAAVLILPVLCCGLFIAAEIGLLAFTSSLSQQH